MKLSVENKQVSIDEALKQKLPGLRLGIILAAVDVETSSEALRAEMLKCFETVADTFQTLAISQNPNVSAARQAYRAIGKDPTKYRVSSEKLLRRISKGEGVDSVNNLVDVANWMSVISANSVGLYDADLIGDQLCFSSGREGESYLNIGRQMMNLENLPIFRDSGKPFGSTTADSLETAVTAQTKHVLFNMIDFNEEDALENHMADAIRLLESYCGAHIMKMEIIK